jgi:acid phosphatase
MSSTGRNHNRHRDRAASRRFRTHAAGAVVALAAGTAVAVGVLPTSVSAATLKAPAQGLYDRHHAPPSGYTSAVRTFVAQVDWSAVEPSNGTFNWTSVDSQVNQAKAAGERVMLRIWAGDQSPAWVKAQDGGPVTIVPNTGGANMTIPRFWTANYDTAYRGLTAAMASRYDTNSTVGVVDTNECMMQYPEPYLRDNWNSSNVANLLKAGYTLSADQACHQREIHSGLDFFHQTVVRIAFNPYQSIDSTGKVKGNVAYTDQMMAAFRQLGGAQAQLGNDSISSTRMNSTDYGDLYAHQKALGAPIGYQTATAAKIGDWQATLKWAVAQGANAVELPTGYTSWPASTLQTYAQQLAANPTGSSGGSGTPTPTPTPTTTTTSTPTPTPTSTTPTPTPTSTGGTGSTGITKVLVVMEENESASTAYPSMPYLSSLASTYGKATHYSAITHPSLPNYLSIAGGSSFGISDDNPPSQHPISGASVFGEAIAKGKTAKSYAESMTSNCQLTTSGNYAVKHNPWAYFTDSAERSACQKNDVPLGTTAAGNLATDAKNGTLPNVGMIIPNLCNDAHNCALSTADNWLKSWMPVLMNGPDYKAGHLAVIVTFDEGGGSNQVVAFAAVSPALKQFSTATAYTHYGLSRALSEVSGSAPLRSAASAADPFAAFHL